MDFEEFCKHSEEMLDYIIHYFESISQKCVTTNVCPGYLKPLLPENAPEKGESLEKIMEDVEKYIMPGLSHWQHPGFHAYFPTISSYPSILAEMLLEVIGYAGFNWNICPSGKELEEIVLDWYGKMIGLPNSFLRYSEESRGGGLIQGTVSECVFMCMIAARQSFLKRAPQISLSKPMLVASLVAYCSSESHSCVQKASVLSMMNLRILDTDDDLRLRGKTLDKAIKEDKKVGLIPFFVNISVGTATGACDPVEEIGLICEKHGIWLNVDATYSGNALICPEYQHYFKGIKHASSITINPAKWLMVPLDCSVVFAKNLNRIKEYMVVDRTMFGYGSSDADWSYRSNKAFLILKLWLMFRIYGIEGLQKHIKNHIELAKLFEKYTKKDNRFEVLTCDFGIVCFRLKGSDEINERLLKAINTCGKLLLNCYNIKGKFSIRFVVCREHANENDIISSWTIIQTLTNDLFEMPDIEDIPKELKNCYDYSLP